VAAICERFDTLGLEDPSRTYRLGIMGGTFDPIHMGHLSCAEEVADAFHLDGVVFMPAGDPWMKHNRRVSGAEDRFAMTRLAVADNPKFCVSRIEIDRAGETYTVDTLRIMRSHYPDNVELYFISGADAIANIASWRGAAELGALAHFVGVTRPGYSMDRAREEYLRSQEDLFDLHQLEITALAISSTDLRTKVRNGQSIRYLTPQPVVEYIQEHGLYPLEV
jgi:nicotinate-nucleotide adenylyltransferase